MIEVLGKKINLTRLASVFLIVVGLLVVILQLGYRIFQGTPFFNENSVIGMAVFICGCYFLYQDRKEFLS
ncbi:drug/metabolite transporter (DMT)-like permease [Alkalihalobacillus xiaoxiensis]|uniref:Drug/metabolite transporter (DMT)-like permease n=1 Tax=Shouchella xiaoxiensis TaxID=766895 RepID=A0ABS2SN69_9BACI|nr:hypothetical protein [Shouchella xiaoxiensis]MBM7836963.1 drug/metabolite transporter (DMT)-like permease [Shouchella xiaoxiensis]